METADVLVLLGDLPVWGWVIFVLFVLFLLGDRGLWDYEAKFPLQPGIGRGEVEFKRYKKKGSSIEVKLELEPEYREKRVAIRLRNQLVCTVPKERNGGERLYLNQSLDLEEPAEGDLVSVEIDGESVFSGPLVLD